MLRHVNKLLAHVYQFLPAPDAATVELRGGYRVMLRPNADRHERHLFYHRTYEAATLAFLDAVLRPGDVMIDIGANLGLMTLHAARAVGPTGRVISIEPHPTYFPRLERNIEMNCLRHVTPLRVAAGDRKETRAIFDVPSVNIGRSSLIRPSAASRNGGEVDVETLDQILSDQQAGHVRLIKIDVEGFEPNVLRGAQATLQMAPIICMEVSADVDKGEANPLAAHDILMDTGLYSAYRFRHGKEHISQLLPVRDRSVLVRQRHDNVVYIPHKVRPTVPDSIFGS